MRLTGKTALVTGGTDGIGAQLIRQLRAKGAQVITTGRNPERVAATRSDGFETIAADLATREGVETLIAAVAGRPIDLLINNAGAGGDHDFRRAAPDVDLAEQVIALNLGAPTVSTRTTSPTTRWRIKRKWVSRWAAITTTRDDPPGACAPTTVGP